MEEKKQKQTMIVSLIVIIIILCIYFQTVIMACFENIDEKVYIIMQYLCLSVFGFIMIFYCTSCIKKIKTF